ncbi:MULTISPECIES: sulfurtransferase-like selenium metabolism protein YedF [unclassified Halanaerobium]|uniref:sulfurtransferase-like selenium metabolism protein YedF n=1 Tax=unclassified Halanaerobium TaxID=2641197 RepID=UPI000DF18DCB|nr:MULTISPECIES: sulfurtransferase-like selenium metabolism protein YedF [unclassified Halanaerobium]RCW45412.1 selenium metabolism protein YedF [Halanaerobium sp. MA284_MarDTE_T2]RCW82590.1 selenium metabolism protein YedF [Halanaerobium sp. DL-01]
MKEIDARGMDCPKPVVLTKKALDDNTKITTIVDNEIAAENVAKLAKKMNCSYSTVKEGEDFFKILITAPEGTVTNESQNDNAKVYLIGSENMGEGEKELGKILMKGFLSTLLDITPRPKKLLFINSGVKLTTIYPETISVLKELEEKGTDILVCGTCLNYYNLTDKIKVGKISNMYEIADSINNGKALIL